MIPEAKGLLYHYLWAASCNAGWSISAIRRWAWDKVQEYPMPEWWRRRVMVDIKAYLNKQADKR